MTTEDILRLRDLGEVSKVQFKERILDKYDIGCELVAMSNFRGGQLVIGINDKTGEFNPLSYAEVQETTNMLSNMASENDERTHEFLITVMRKEDLGTDSDTLTLDLDTKEGCPNTDSDTFKSDSNTFKPNSDTKEGYPNTTPNTKDECPDTIRTKLSNKQKDIVNFCSVPRSSREILERVGVRYHNTNIKRYVTALVEAGYLEMTNPDNPNASNQKYRKK